MQKMAREQMRSGRRRVGSGSSQEGASSGGGRPRSATWSHDEVKKSVFEYLRGRCLQVGLGMVRTVNIFIDG